MKCIKCNSKLEKEDNFCYNCGHFTARGLLGANNEYDKNKNIGYVDKQNNAIFNIFILLFLLIIIFSFIIFVRGYDILKPFVFIKKQAFNYKYGYNTSVIITNNIYNDVDVNNIDDALSYIEKDAVYQKWQCKNNYEVVKIEDLIASNYKIKNVNFCDISYSTAKNIFDVIDRFFVLFPNSYGKLTNISITNSKNKDDYVAYFQPIYQFVNNNNDINKYNRVNKTQILLNSYYFLNDNVKINKELYVKDSSKESLIAHELGHYLIFLVILDNYNIDNVTFVNKNNIQEIIKVIDDVNSSNTSKLILDEAVKLYNNKYSNNIDDYYLAGSISNYALDSIKNKIYDEVIAEAVHDYYLHGNNMNKESSVIIEVLKSKLG